MALTPLSPERSVTAAVASMGAEPTVGEALAAFLADLAPAARSPHTRRAYAADLSAFQATYDGPVAVVTAATLPAFVVTVAHRRPVTGARKQATLADARAGQGKRRRHSRHSGSRPAALPALGGCGHG